MTHVVTCQPTVAMMDSPHEVYVARGARLVGEPADVEEAGRVAWVPLASILDLMAWGEVLGAGSLVGLLHILATRNGSSSS